MASLVNPQNGISTSSRFQDSSENRPKMLKDFLKDDNFHSYTSPSSNGFSMYPRKMVRTQSAELLPSKSNKTSVVLLRSQSKRAAENTISAINKVINVVKFLPFASAKSPLALHKRVLRKFSNKKSAGIKTETANKVKVKDILRWKSFRDLVEERPTFVEYSTSPNRCTTTSTTITTTTTTSSCSRRSSWCDSDFTAEDLPLGCGGSEEFWAEKSFLGHHGEDVTLTNPKGGWSTDEFEQQSPVSVLESTFRESEGFFSPFRRILANAQTTILEEEEEEVNEVEEKAYELLNQLKESSTLNSCDNQHIFDVILDYFVHELSGNEILNNVDFECEVLSTAKSWMNSQFAESYEWESLEKREAYVKDMEKEVSWKEFKQEQEEIAKELEVKVLNELLDEILDDLLNNA